ncbi:MAG: hypothetical protein AMJ84_01535 [Acidithiobacillales bacterium SM23_46]|nr:MAG: hypothetical protein AMJ84_01535 [Acidithiobacillales bacterium SM23_46]
MRKRVYIESTVVSYFVAGPSRDLIVAARQESTRDLWPKILSRFDTYISALVYQEAARGETEQADKRLGVIKPFTMLDVDKEAQAVAEKIIAGKGIPQEHPEDALHVAVAAVNGIEILVTWNFAHLNNPLTRLMIRETVEEAGYPCPEICSPDELLESEA